jgi:MSHA biogenesis protein MshQ
MNMKPEPWVAGAVWCARALLIALLFTHPIPSWGSISYVASSASALVSPAVGSVTITAPAGLVTGDVLIAFVGQDQDASGLPVVNAVPAGWTLVLEKNDGSSIGVAAYSRVATSADVAGTTTYTWTFQGSARSGGLMLDFRGVLSTVPVVTSAATVNGTTTNYSAPSITPGISNTELVVLLAADNGTGGINVPTGMTSANAGGTGAGPNGLFIGAFTEALTASTATGTLQSTANSSAANIGISLALQSAAGATPDHFAISDAGTAVNCQASPVTITAHSATHTVVSTTATIMVSTSTTHGDWSLAAGAGSFAPGAANSGMATYTYVTADSGAVTLSLKDTYAETVTINVAAGSVTQTSGSAIGSEQPQLTFVSSGFRITNGNNVGVTIATQIAAKSSTQTLALQAVRTDTNTGACTAVFANNATVNVSFAYQCNNPTSCVAGQTLAFTNNSITTNIPSNANGSVSTYTTPPVSLKFSTANAEAPFSFSYSDVGQITLYARYFIPLGSSGPDSGNTMIGSSQFVVQPSNFLLTNIKCATFGAGTCSTALGAPGNNPGATLATDPAFIQAGQAFSTTVTAKNFAGAATPNYGQEIAPPGVTLSANLILPVGGNAPALNNGLGFVSFSAGIATGTTFNWPEVGIITLTPGVANYLGSGAVTGTASGNVGRFIPNAFTAVPNTPLFGTFCAKDLAGNPLPGGGFSYLGQPLTFTLPPVLTVTALSATGSTARNYTGAFFKLTNSTLTGRTYTPTPASPALDSSGISTATDPAIIDLGSVPATAALSGQATLTFGMGTGTGLLFTRLAAVAPFNANISLSINVKDSDGIAAPNPVSFGSAIGFIPSAAQYYGRLALRDAVGSELLDLPMALTTQYYVSTTQGFTTNTNDSCTTLATPSIALSNFLLPLTSACVRDSGKPGASGVGCPVAAPLPYNAKASSGNFNLVFAAPGSGFNGTMTVIGTAPAWLQYAWTGGANKNPTGIAAFGVFSGQASRVYQREVY